MFLGWFLALIAIVMLFYFVGVVLAFLFSIWPIILFLAVIWYVYRKKA